MFKVIHPLPNKALYGSSLIYFIGPLHHQVLDVVDLSVNCTHDGNALVLWTVKNNYHIKQFKLEYSCRNTSGNTVLVNYKVAMCSFEK